MEVASLEPPGPFYIFNNAVPAGDHNDSRYPFTIVRASNALREEFGWMIETRVPHRTRSDELTATDA